MSLTFEWVCGSLLIILLLLCGLSRWLDRIQDRRWRRFHEAYDRYWTERLERYKARGLPMGDGFDLSLDGEPGMPPELMNPPKW